uniref:Glycine N-acyltransferase-like protein n=1 Tax=Ditylenchus dipsaci TaxID=166011 RepID=A0A915DVZ2_9BILA
MIGEYYHTNAEFQIVSKSIGSPNPGNLLLHGSVKAAKNTPSPHVTWNFAKYSLPAVNNVLWVTLRKNHLTRPFIIFSLEKEDLEFGGLDLTDVFQELHVKFLDHFCDQVWIYGIKELLHMYKEWSHKHKMDGRLDLQDTNFYYMVPEVIQELERTGLQLHSDFYFDEIDFEKDLDLITNSWSLSMPLEKEQFRQKLTLLPYSLVREKETDKLACFELMDFSGCLNHQYTFPEFRRKGLAKCVEMDLCQKMIKKGDIPFKWVEAWNIDVIKPLERSNIWQRWQNKNGEYITFSFLWNHC